MSPGTEHEDRFRRVYAGNFAALLAYALRRVAQPADAADVVAETFLVAWRRSREMPPDGEARLWLYGVARRVLANHHRGVVRRERLGERLRQRITAAVVPDHGAEVPDRLDVRRALARVGELDREVLLLTVWEGLEPREAAAVLGVSPAVVRSRLTRARIAEWLRAKKAGDTAAAQRAVAALRSSHQWRVLQRMVDQGDWSEAFWEVADQVVAGKDPGEQATGIGCE